MSSYFDNASSDVHNCASLPERDLVETVKGIENKVVHDCLLATGDREFPDDLRQKIVGHIALFTLGYGEMTPSEKGIDWLKSVKNSRLINLLHEDFHEVARRRIQTRFGLLSDNPANIVARRDSEDSSHG